MSAISSKTKRKSKVWMIKHAANCRGSQRRGWSYGRRRCEEHCDSQVSDATIVRWNWSSCYLHVVDGMTVVCHWLAVYLVFQAANDRRWDNYRQSALFVHRQAPCSRMCVYVTVAVNAVCAGELHVWDMHSCTISDSLGPSEPLSIYVIWTANAAPHTCNQRLITNRSNRVCWSQHRLWRDWCLLSVVCALCATVGRAQCNKWDRCDYTISVSHSN